MAEHSFVGQSNMGMSSTLKMARPVPAIADRIFDLKTDAEEFLTRQFTSAIPGLVLSVIADSTTGNNGVYQVIKSSTSTSGLELKKIGSDIDLNIRSLIKGMPNEETSTTDYVEINTGDKVNKLFTISTDMLRNGSLTLVLDGHF